MAQPKKQENVAARETVTKMNLNPAAVLDAIYKKLNDVGADLTNMINASNLYDKAIEDKKLDLAYLGEISDISLKLSDIQRESDTAKRTFQDQLKLQDAQLDSDKKQKAIELADYCKEQTAQLDAKIAEFNQMVTQFQATRKDYEERAILSEKLAKTESELKGAAIALSNTKKDYENAAALEKMRTDGIIQNLTDKVSTKDNEIAKMSTYIASLEEKVANAAKMISEVSGKAMDAFSTKGQSESMMKLVTEMSGPNGSGRKS